MEKLLSKPWFKHTNMRKQVRKHVLMSRHGILIVAYHSIAHPPTGASCRLAKRTLLRSLGGAGALGGACGFEPGQLPLIS